MKYCPICEKEYGDELEVCAVDGNKLKMSGVERRDPVGKTIRDRYRILQKLGEGGMSVVYLAEQINIERKVAVKVLHQDYARDEAFVRRFRQEARLAASLNHSNVIQIYDFDQAEDGNLFIAMEYLVGKTLKEIIRERSLDVPKAVCLARQIADGLSAAHHAGVIHRDIKPENIMVVGKGDEIKLMDFGIARLREAGTSTRLTRAGTIMGTPAYMAPEQIEGGQITDKTDIYAFGIVLYEMLSNVVPFSAPTPAAVLMKHLKEVPAPLRKLRREVPAALERVVTQALEKKPERRPGKIDEITETLRKMERGYAHEAVPKTIITTQPLEVTRNRESEGPRGIRGLLEKIRSGPRADRRAEPVQIEEERHSPQKIPERRDPTELGQPTVVATMVVTQPLEALRQKRINWTWVALGGGALLGVSVILWAGGVIYRAVPQRDGERVATLEQPIATVPHRAGQIVSVTIAADRLELITKERTGVRLSAQYADGTKVHAEEAVEWTSSDPGVAQVSSGGDVEAVGIGKAEIAARYKGIAAHPITILVTQPLLPTRGSETKLGSLRIQGEKREIGVTGRLSLRVLAMHSDGGENEIRKGVRWESSDSRIATVNSRGEVLARKEGNVRVVARAGEMVSEPFHLIVKPLVKGRERDSTIRGSHKESTDPTRTTREREIIKDPDGGKKAREIDQHLRTARLHRERGEYSQALAELEKAGKMDPGSKDVHGEIAVTRRACNAERTLGRTELKC